MMNANLASLYIGTLQSITKALTLDGFHTSLYEHQKFSYDYHETKASPTLSHTVNRAIKILKIRKNEEVTAKIQEKLLKRSTEKMLPYTNTGTKSEVPEYQVCSFLQS